MSSPLSYFSWSTFVCFKKFPKDLALSTACFRSGNSPFFSLIKSFTTPPKRSITGSSMLLVSPKIFLALSSALFNLFLLLVCVLYFSVTSFTVKSPFSVSVFILRVLNSTLPSAIHFLIAL